MQHAGGSLRDKLASLVSLDPYACVAATSAACAAGAFRHGAIRLMILQITISLAMLAVPVVLQGITSYLRESLGLGAGVNLIFRLRPACVRLGVENVQLQPDGKVAKSACLPLPLTLTGLSAKELGVELKLRSPHIELQLEALQLKVRMADPSEWDHQSAAQNARASALLELRNRYHSLEKKRSEQQSSTYPGCCSSNRERPSWKSKILDKIINSTAIRASEFSLLVGASSCTGCRNLRERHSSEMYIRLGWSLLRLPPAILEPGESRSVAELSQDGMHAELWRRKADISNFGLEVKPVASDPRPETLHTAANELNLLGPVAASSLTIRMPSLLGHLLSGHSQPSRKVALEFAVVVPRRSCNPAMPLNLCKQGMNVLWSMLERYSAAATWQQQLLEADQRSAALGADSALRGAAPRDRVLDADERKILAKKNEKLTWAELEKILLHPATSREQPADLRGCSHSDLLALRYASTVGADIFGVAEDSQWQRNRDSLWQEAGDAMTTFAAREAIFHELDIRIYGSFDIDLGNGAARIRVQKGHLWFRSCIINTEAGFEACTALSIDSMPTASLGGQCGTSQKHALLRGGCDLKGSQQPKTRDNEAKAPIFKMSINWPASGGKDLDVLANTILLRALPLPWIGLQGVLYSLLESGPVPPTPDLYSPLESDLVSPAPGPGAATASASTVDTTALPTCVTLLGGMTLRMSFSATDVGVSLPVQPDSEPKRDFDGLQFFASNLQVGLFSRPEEEELEVFGVGASVLAPGGYEVLRPMPDIRVNYTSMWKDIKDDGTRVPVQDLSIVFPMAKISASLSVVQVVDACTKLLNLGLAHMNDGTPGANVTQGEHQTENDKEDDLPDNFDSHSRMIEKYRQLFAELDADRSGQLDRKELFEFMESLCVEERSLTKQELASEFESFWTTIDVSNDGKVSFDELWGALTRLAKNSDHDSSMPSSYGDAFQCRPHRGPLDISAGDLCCHEVVSQIEGLEDRLWELLEPIGVQAKPGGGVPAQSPLTMQWKLLRGLRHFKQARIWWESSVQQQVAPHAAWEIGHTTKYFAARDIIAAALSGHVLSTTAIEVSTPSGQSVTSASLRTGLQVSVVCAGVKLRLKDPLSQLSGRYRLCMGMGWTKDALTTTWEDACLKKALEFRLSNYYSDGTAQIGLRDSVSASLSVRGIFGCCMNPFRTQPEHFIERWGFRVEVSKQEGEAPIVFRLISDTHCVINVTSSLLLAVKPIVQTLMPRCEEPLDNKAASKPGLICRSTSPLAHVLRGLGELKQKTIQELQLQLCGPAGPGIGTDVPQANEITFWEDSDAAVLETCRRGQKWSLQFTIGSRIALTSILVPSDWVVTYVRQLSEVCYIIVLESTLKSDAKPAFKVHGVTWHPDCSGDLVTTRGGAALSPAIDQDPETGFAQSPECEEDRKNFNCKRKKLLQVINRCGVDARIWFEQAAGKPKLDVPPNKEVICSVPELSLDLATSFASSLCVSLSNEEGVIRPDLLNFGQCALALGGHLPGLGIASGNSHDRCCCVSASLSVGLRGQALLELLPPLELHNATTRPLLMQFLPPQHDHKAVSDDARSGLECSRTDAEGTAALDAVAIAPQPSVVQPGERLQIPITLLQSSGWQVLAEEVTTDDFPSSLSFAFLLGGPLLQVGRAGFELRRSLGLCLETSTIASECGGSLNSSYLLGSSMSNISGRPSRNNSSSRRATTSKTMQRYSLLLLPGLRVVNSLPVSLRITVQRQELEAEECTISPGAGAEFGRMPFGCVLQVAPATKISGVPASSTLCISADALKDAAAFRKLKSEQLDLGDGVACSLQCTWKAGGCPEMILTGSCIVFNKTGLPLQVQDGKARDSREAALKPGLCAILRAREEIKIGISENHGQHPNEPPLPLPSHSGDLELRMMSGSDDSETIFEWCAHHVIFSEGVVQLQQHDLPPALWPLSAHSSVVAVEPDLANGAKHCFCLKDPYRGHELLLKAQSRKEQLVWLQRLGQVAAMMMQAKDFRTTAGWDFVSNGACYRAGLPNIFQGAWCCSKVPVQAPGDGEIVFKAFAAEDQKKRDPLHLYLGVQVRPLVDLSNCSQGVTVTPRFIVRNASSCFLQLQPGLLPPSEAKWPQSDTSSEAAIKEAMGETQPHRAGPKDSHEALWVPPGESLSLFHFPRLCSVAEADTGRRAVAMRPPGRAPLRILSCDKKQHLVIDEVPFSSDFAPYHDALFQLGQLPQCLSRLAQQRRLLCLRGEYKRQMALGTLALTADADVYIALRRDSPPAEWLLSFPWAEVPSTKIDLRHKGRAEDSLKLFHAQLRKGTFCIDDAGLGCLLFVARNVAGQYSASHFSELGEGAGLPWSRWMSLDATCEDVMTIYCAGGTTGDALTPHFLRCSVQVNDSTCFLVLSDEPAPYRVENRSLSRTLAFTYHGGKKYQILPPLSWVEGDWPEFARRERRLIVHDIQTHCMQVYDADEIGFGQPLHLSNDADVTGQLAELSEAGYLQIALLHDAAEMSTFASRVAAELGGQEVPPDVLQAISRRHSDGEAIQSLRQMRQEMIVQGLVPSPEPELTQAGYSAAKMCLHTMVRFIEALLFAVGLAASDQAQLRMYSARAERGRSLQPILQDLPAMSWVEELAPVDDVYGRIAPSSEQEVTATILQLCLRRVSLCSGSTLRTAARQDLERIAASLAHEFCNTHQAKPSWAGILSRAEADVVDEASQRMGANQKDWIDGQAEDSSTENATKDVAGREEVNVAMSQPLTEEGYLAVARLCNTGAMAMFVRRVLTDEGAEVLDQHGLLEFSYLYSGERAQHRCLGDMRVDLLKGQPWARFGTTHRGKLFVDRWFDGVSKVFSITENMPHEVVRRKAVAAPRTHESTASQSSLPDSKWWDIDVQLAGMHLCFIFQARPHFRGTGVELDERTTDEEILAITVDHIRLCKARGQEKLEFMVHHVQVDNMRQAHRSRPIIMSPADSGYYSDAREQHRSGNAVDFLFVSVEVVAGGILHFKELQILLQPFNIRLDAGFLMKFGLQLMEWSYANAAEHADDSDIVVKQVCRLLSGGIEVPSAASASQPVYIELMRLGALIANVELIMPKKFPSSSAGGQGEGSDSKTGIMVDGGEDEQDLVWAQSVWISRMLAKMALTSKGYFRKTLMLSQSILLFFMQSIGTGVLTSIGHVSPVFNFPETIYQNEFTDLRPFTASLTRSYSKAALNQWWKIVLSMNVIGDPIGLGTSVVGGFVQLFRKTGSEVLAGDLRGEGLKCLAQGVVGGAFATTGKIFGTLGDAVDAIGHTGGSASSGFQPRSVSHVGDGLAVGAQVVAHGTASGLVGVFKDPVIGFQRAGAKGLMVGLAKGVSGVVAKPLAGIMHGVQQVAEGVDATTHLWDNNGEIVVRRAPRNVSSLAPLIGSEFCPLITIFVESITFPSFEGVNGNDASLTSQGDWLRCSNCCVQFRCAADSRKSKVTRLGRLAQKGRVLINEVKWMPTQLLLDSDLQIDILDGASMWKSASEACTLYSVTIPRKRDSPLAVLPRVAKILQEPEVLIRGGGVGAVRSRPREPVRVKLQGATTGEQQEPAELCLYFWPAWDQPRVPPTQHWRPAPQAESAASSLERQETPAPQPRRGWLEKRSTGAMHHWSAKWVVLEDRKFQYWDDKRHFDEGHDPKVRYHLTKSECLPKGECRFADDASPDSFIQLHVTGKTVSKEAAWRLHSSSSSRGQPPAETKADWLQAIFQHSFVD